MISRLYIILFALVAAAATPAAHAFDRGYYAAHSRLASGHWVKIKADTEGIYQISYDKLNEWGFADPSQVNVYGYGAVDLMSHNFDSSHPDDIKQIPAMHTADGRILFYAIGDVRVTLDNTSEQVGTTGRMPDNPDRVRNLYDKTSYYFLSDVDGPAALVTTPYAEPSASLAPVTNHIHVDLYEDENFSPVGYGMIFHGKQYAATDMIPFTFEIKNFEASATDANILFYHLLGARRTGSGLQTMIDVSSYPAGTVKVKESSNYFLNSTDFTPFTSASSRLWLKASNSSAGVADQQVTFRCKPNFTDLTYFADDYAILAYPRRNVLGDDPYMVMTLSSLSNDKGRSVVFPDADRHLQLWLVDNSYAVEPVEGRYDESSYSKKFTLPRKSTRAVAFNPASTDFPVAEFAGEVAAQDLHGAPTPHLLIISSKEYMPLAEDLAEIHRRYQNYDVLVVSQDQAFNEFSSGTRSVQAYRRLAKMFYDREPGKMRGIILYGAGSYDNRCLTIDDRDRMLTYQTTDFQLANNVVDCYASDNIFGMLLDNYNHNDIERLPMQVPVGRIPVLNAAEGSSYNSKIEHRLSNVLSPDVYAHVIYLSGNMNDNAHLQQSVEVRKTMAEANSHLQHDMIPINIYPYSDRDGAAYAHMLIASALKRGSGYMTYTGHGGASFVGIGGYLDNASVGSDKYDVAPFVTFASCHQYEFDKLSRSLLDIMLFERDGGAIGGVGAGRSVYLQQNIFTSKSMGYAYAKAKPGDTFGDVYVAARNWLLNQIVNPGDNNGTLVNNMAYNFCGDPAVPVGVPEYGCLLSSIGGQSPASATVEPLKPVNMVGSVVDASGRTLTSFNGSVFVRIFDGAHTEESWKMSGETDNFRPYPVELENDVLASAWGTVKDGRFTISVTVPEKFYAADDHLVVIAATDPETGATAVTNARVKIAAEAAGGSSTTPAAPSIIELYTTSDGANASADVPTDFVVYALIDPSSVGLNFSQTGLKPRSRLVIDGTSPVSRIENALTCREDGMFELRWPVDGLSEGRHSIELIVANNAGLTDRAIIDVNCITRSINASVRIDEPVASRTAVIELDGDEAEHCRLLISDHKGNTIFVKDNVTMPYEWNLTDNSGAQVPNGLYKVSLLMRDGRYYGHTAAGKIIVIR
ncbi:MAG: C25 family cysteine peptidase [Bacteroidales bacterium]|nr:C25 family cysteine peptidase [Bacteroidales bacterium]